MDGIENLAINWLFPHLKHLITLTHLLKIAVIKRFIMTYNTNHSVIIVYIKRYMYMLLRN